MSRSRSFGSYAYDYLGQGQDYWYSHGTTTLQDNTLGIGVRTNDSGGYTYYTRSPNGQPLGARNPDGTRTYNIPDSMGSTVAITDQNGNLISRITYDPWGNPTTTTTPTSSQLADFSLRLDGGYYSTSAGLYHYGARFYDPTLQRWTQQDPLNQAGDLRQGNPYNYTGDNPINLMDLTGRCILDIACGVQNDIANGATSAYHFVSRNAAAVGLIAGGSALAVGAFIGLSRHRCGQCQRILSACGSCGR